MSRFFIILLCLCFVSLPLRAQDSVVDYASKPLPDTIGLKEEEEFINDTLFYDEKPYGEELLAYQIRLPKDWVKADEPTVVGDVVVKNLLREIARFNGPPINRVRGRFTIRAEELAYQTTAKQWFLQHALANALNIEGIEEKSKFELEAFYVQVEEGISYVVRSKVYINGTKVIFAEYLLPSEHWKAASTMQNSSIKSFRLNKMKEAIVENFKTYEFLDVAQFSYPESWSLQTHPIRNVDRFQAQLNKAAPDGTLRGAIDIRLISMKSADSLAKEVDKYTAELVAKNLSIGDVIERIKGYELFEGQKLAGVEVYKLSNSAERSIDYELFFTIMAGKGYYTFVTMITPARSEDYFLWSQNAESYKLITQSVHPF